MTVAVEVKMGLENDVKSIVKEPKQNALVLPDVLCFDDLEIEAIEFVLIAYPFEFRVLAQIVN